MSKNHINLIKLCVGVDTIEDLETWQAARAASSKTPHAFCPRHVTRMWPKRQTEVLAGGSLYWVIKGVVSVRQKIVALDEVFGEDGIRRCAIVMDRTLIRTTPVLRRPFQGWRYLVAQDAPPDLPQARRHEEALPQELATVLAEIGLR